MRQLLAVLVVTVAGCPAEHLEFLDAPVVNHHDAPAQAIDSATATCTVATSLGTVAPLAQMAQDDVDPPNSLVYTAGLNADALPDGLAIQLSSGFGAFKTMRIGPGTFPLSGDESSMVSCGICMRIRSNIDSHDSAEAVYMPLSGSMTITSVSGNFTGTLTNVLFRQVDIDGANLMTTDSPSHCKATIGSLAFDKAITVNSAP